MVNILVVYELTGTGHLRMANIIEDALQDIENVNITKIEGCDLLNSDDRKKIADLWNNLMKKNWINLTDFLINFFIREMIVPCIEMTEIVTFMQNLRELNPDIIITTYDAYTKGLACYCMQAGIPLFSFLTSINSYNDEIHPYATHACYFNETIDVIRKFNFNTDYYKVNVQFGEKPSFRKKMSYVLNYYWQYLLKPKKNPYCIQITDEREQKNNSRCFSLGPIAEEKHYTQIDPGVIRKEMVIPDNGKNNILIVSGGIGGKFVLKVLNRILKDYTKEANLLVACGRDEETRKMIENISNSEKLTIIPFGFTDKFHMLLQISDCVITRASHSTFTESLISRTPSITFSTVPTNDKGTLDMIEKYDIGVVCKKMKDLVPAVEKIVANSNRYQENIDRLLAPYTIDYDFLKKKIGEIVLESVLYSENLILEG